MLDLIFLVILTGVCAPFDWNDCDYIIEFIPMTSNWGFWDGGKKISFSPGYETAKDCFGNTTWRHEWLHVEFGGWHYPKNGCMLQDWFSFPEN